MMYSISRARFSLGVVLGLVVASLGAFATPLDDYVAAPDANYTYNPTSSFDGGAYWAYTYSMTSQKWRTPAEVSPNLWQHNLTIIVPNTILTDVALLFVTGGQNGGPAPLPPDGNLVSIATSLGAVVANLPNVPAQPLTFTGDPFGPRTGNDLMAYTDDRYLATGDGTWPALLPMVKSAVRAMDTVQVEVNAITGGASSVNSFVVSGYSKRGWTTWLTAAADSRVVGIVPGAFDMLNMDEQMVHQFGVYGFYAGAVKSWTDLNVMQRLGTTEGQALLAIIDPFEYRARYAGIPKLLMNASGDELFVSDSARFYFGDLPGEKRLRYFPNTSHGLVTDTGRDPSSWVSMGLFLNSVIQGTPMPDFTWTVNTADTITVQVVDAPSVVRLWQATNPSTRDFRRTIGGVPTGITWTSSVLTEQQPGHYVGQVSQPVSGWTAFFVELSYPQGSFTNKFTTEVRVVPDNEPFNPVPDTSSSGGGSVEEGNLVSLNVAISGGVEPYSGFQWLKNGAPVPENAPRVTGTASQTIVLNTATIDDSGTYQLQFEDSSKGGPFFSDMIPLQVFPAGSLPLPVVGVLGLGLMAAACAAAGALGIGRKRRKSL